MTDQLTPDEIRGRLCAIEVLSSSILAVLLSGHPDIERTAASLKAEIEHVRSTCRSDAEFNAARGSTERVVNMAVHHAKQINRHMANATFQHGAN